MSKVDRDTKELLKPRMKPKQNIIVQCYGAKLWKLLLDAQKGLFHVSDRDGQDLADETEPSLSIHSRQEVATATFPTDNEVSF